jgi:hypothetical protein
LTKISYFSSKPTFSSNLLIAVLLYTGSFRKVVGGLGLVIALKKELMLSLGDSTGSGDTSVLILSALLVLIYMLRTGCLDVIILGYSTFCFGLYGFTV